MFLLSLATVPIACGDDAVANDSGSSSTTTEPAPSAMGSTGAVMSTGAVSDDPAETTSGGVDSTTGADSSGAETTVGLGDSGTGTTTAGPGSSSGSSATAGTSGGPGSESSEGGVTTGALGICEQWANAAVDLCGYGGYYNVDYWTNYCYVVPQYAAPACMAQSMAIFECEAMDGGPCGGGCGAVQQAFSDCEDQAYADMLGCDMIPIVVSGGNIPAQCSGLVTEAIACDAAGYYLLGLSPYVGEPEQAQYRCEYGLYFTPFESPEMTSPECGGAYEELLTCLSGLDCAALEDALFFGDTCQQERDGVTCRCDLGS